MRIIYHHRTLGDGAEGVHIDSMVTAFRALHHEVSMASLAKPSGAGRGDDGLIASVRARLPQALFEAGTLAANVPEFVAMRRRLAASSPGFLYKRHALFDIGAVQAAARAGVPVVLEVNRLYSSPAMGQFEPLTFARLARRLERRILRLATIVVAVSTPLRRQIEEVAGSDLDVMVLPNGADPDLFDPRRVDGREIRARHNLTDRFVVGWVGVLRQWHGLDLLLRAVHRVHEASLLIVGDGPARREVEALAESLGLSDRVRITGRVDHQEVPRHIAAFDAAASPDDRTGFASPMKVIEYMSMARPVIVPRLDNLLDIVRDGATGLTFTQGDAGDLAARIRELYASPDLRLRLGGAAREDIERRLNWRENARRVLAALRERDRNGLTCGASGAVEAIDAK